MTTPREQLADIIAWFFGPDDTPYDVADAIIAAGWTPRAEPIIQPRSTDVNGTSEPSAEKTIEALIHRTSTAVEMYLFQLEEASRARVQLSSLVTSAQSIAERLEHATEYLRLKTKERQ